MNVLNALNRIDRTGHIGRRIGERLICEGLACFGGPRPEIGVEFNCIHVTDSGRALIERNENYDIQD